jgi:pyroglutamyl-peptidase
MAVLPVVATTVGQVLADHVDRVRPDAIVGLGECRGADLIKVERVAVNLLDFAADNSGAACRDASIVPDGPMAYRSTLPDRAIRDALADRGIPCDLSMTAGTYLCN